MITHDEIEAARKMIFTTKSSIGIGSYTDLHAFPKHIDFPFLRIASGIRVFLTVFECETHF
jgi:hypothetical protein